MLKNYKIFVAFILMATLLSGCTNFQSSTPFSLVPEVKISALDRTFTKIGKSYDEISAITEINNKIVAIAKNEKMFLLFGEKEFGPYDMVNNHIIPFQNGIAFFALKGGDRFLVTDQYSIRLSPVQFPSDVFTETLKEINGKIAFEAGKSEESALDGVGSYNYPRLFYDFKELGGQYDYAHNLTEENGALYYEASQNEKRFIIENNKPLNNSFEETFDLAKVNGSISYLGQKNGEKYLILKEKIVGPFSSLLIKPKAVMGKITFALQENDGKKYLFYDEEKFGPYSEIKEPYRTQNSHLFDEHAIFIVEKNKRKNIFIDAKEFGPVVDIPDDKNTFQEDQGELYFVTLEKNGNRYALHEGKNGKKIAGNYEDIPEVIGGKIVFLKYIYKNGSKMPFDTDFFVNEENVSQKYKSKYPYLIPMNFNGTLAFKARTAVDRGAPFFILMNEKEYGPFSGNDKFEIFKKYVLFEFRNTSGKKELYYTKIL